MVECVHMSTGQLATDKIAYLILAHHQPAHLARLVRALSSPNARFFIHIDKKVDIASFRDHLGDNPQVEFLAERTAVYWAGFSMVTAVLQLMSAAVEWPENFRYLVLLSGSCYPIKSREAIEQRLLNSNLQFIKVGRRITGDRRDRKRDEHSRMIEQYHFIDNYLLNPRSSMLKMSAAGLAHAVLSRISYRISRVLPKRQYPEGFIPYHGNLFSSLTQACVEHILAFTRDNPSFLKFHRFVSSSDEFYFHTIIKHSPFRDQIAQDFEKSPGQDDIHHGNHFIDWENADLNPEFILDERYFERLLNSDALFARKFDKKRSARLLALLDDHFLL